MNNLANNIATIRKARGFSQIQLADLIGVSRPTYAAVEQGVKDLTMSQAERIASVLRVDLDELRKGQDMSAAINPENALAKYKQIILNALQYGADSTDGKITKTKLAKLVYLADFTWFYENLVPMSGMSYRKLPRGPVPDIYFRALDELEEDGVISREEKGKSIILGMAESAPAPSTKLATGEQRMIKQLAKAWKDKQTSEIVDFTHDQLPWQICREGEVIPYSLITQEEPDAVYGPAKPKL